MTFLFPFPTGVDFACKGFYLCPSCSQKRTLLFSGLEKMTEYFRRKVINLFLKKNLISEDFAWNLLSWKNSGFSIDNSVRILIDKGIQYIRRYGLYASRTPTGVDYDSPDE